MAQPPTQADGGSSTDSEDYTRGYRVNCTQCDDLDGSTEYELFAERDLVAQQHEHDTGHDVERTPASPEAMTDGGEAVDEAEDKSANDDWSGKNLTWGQEFLLKIQAEGRESVGEIGLLVADKAAVNHLRSAGGFLPPHDGKPSSWALMDETAATFETEHASLTATLYSDTHTEEDAEAVFSAIEDTLADASRLDQIRVTVDEQWSRVSEGDDA